MAMSADGKIAPPHRRFVAIGSRRDHDNLIKLRATADAVMCGARTVEAGNITMDAGGEKFERQRLAKRLTKQNLRVLISGSGSIDPEAAIFKNRNSPIVVFVSSKAPEKRLAKLRTLADEVIVCGAKSVSLGQALGRLRRDWKVNRLLCEGGGELNFNLLRLGLVNELHLTICPHLLGGRSSPTLADGLGFQTLANAAQLKLTTHRRIGDELFSVWRVRPRSR